MLSGGKVATEGKKQTADLDILTESCYHFHH